jgi:hypothetical protein
MGEQFSVVGWSERTQACVEVEIDAAHVRQDLPTLARNEAGKSVGDGFRGGIPGKDPAVPEIGRWAAVVLTEDLEPARGALAPLLEARAGVAWRGKAGPGLLVIDRPDTDTNTDRWIMRLRDCAGKAAMTASQAPPHYLLLVGGPDRFPFDVQRAFDQDFITGRLDAGGPEGTIDWDACAAYARKVARYEAGEMPVSPEALLFSFAIDSATRAAHQELTVPLRDYLRAPLGWKRAAGAARELFDLAATSQELVTSLRAARPALVFTTSHGIEFPTVRERWGALTDSTFVGSTGGAPLSANSVCNLESFAEGAVFFAFACFSVGVPATSLFATAASDGSRPSIEGAPFTAPLPRTLLGHPRGPIAFIGHVDRVSNRCFSSSLSGKPLGPFIDFLDWSLGGFGTLGQGMTTFRDRGKSALTGLVRHLSPVAMRRKSATDADLTDLWIRYYDFSSFILLGDPAIRLRV